MSKNFRKLICIVHVSHIIIIYVTHQNLMCNTSKNYVEHIVYAGLNLRRKGWYIFYFLSYVCREGKSSEMINSVNHYVYTGSEKFRLTKKVLITMYVGKSSDWVRKSPDHHVCKEKFRLKKKR